MSTEAKEQELSSWLRKHGLEEYLTKLNEAGVGVVSDFKVLENKSEIESLASDVGITKIIHKKKFVKAVAELIGISSTSDKTGATEPAKIPDLPESKIDDLKQTGDEIEKPDITPPETSLPSSGAAQSTDDVTVDDLKENEKAELFSGTRNLLCGRVIDVDNNDISASRYNLLELKDDIKEWDQIIKPINEKEVIMNESYTALQKTFTENSYWSASVQVGVAGFGGFSSSYSQFKEKQTIDTSTRLSITATSRMIKGEIYIDGSSVKYNDGFIKELDALLDNSVTDKSRWIEFTNKYGQFCVTHCEIGGAAYSTKDVTVEDNKARDSQRSEFLASFNATIKGVDIGGSVGHGSGTSSSEEKINKETTVSLNCHGGKPALCSPDSFGAWEASVDSGYKRWDIIEVKQVMPFYYLLDKDKQEKIKALMPKAIELPKEPDSESIKYDPSQKCQIALLANNKKYVSCDGSGKCSVRSTELRDYELFTSTPGINTGDVSLQSHYGRELIAKDGQLISMDKKGMEQLFISQIFSYGFTNGKVQVGQTFTVEEINDHQFSFKINDRYVSAHSDGTIDVKGSNLSEYEKFTVKVIE